MWLHPAEGVGWNQAGNAAWCHPAPLSYPGRWTRPPPLLTAARSCCCRYDEGPAVLVLCPPSIRPDFCHLAGLDARVWAAASATSFPWCPVTRGESQGLKMLRVLALSPSCAEHLPVQRAVIPLLRAQGLLSSPCRGGMNLGVQRSRAQAGFECNGTECKLAGPCVCCTQGVEAERNTR